MNTKSLWKSAKLKDLVFFQRGFDITKEQQTEGIYPVISSSGIKSFHNEYQVKGPGVIIGRKGSLGTIYYSEGDYWPHDTTLWSKSLNGNEPKFVYYALHTIPLGKFNVGGANPTLNRNHIHEIDIRIPSISIQQKIASILSAYDDLIDNNRRRIQLLEQAARLLYKEWFVALRFPGHEHVAIVNGVPEGWEKKKIGEITETIGGGTPSTKIPEYWEDGDITWFIPKDLTNNDCLVLLDSEKKITEAGLKKSSAKMLPSETILMTSRASIGYFGLYKGEACTNQGFISTIPQQNNLKMYLLHNLMNRKEELLARAGGTTYKEINKTTFRNISVVIPPTHLLEQFEEFAYDIIKQVRILNNTSDSFKPRWLHS